MIHAPRRILLAAAVLASAAPASAQNQVDFAPFFDVASPLELTAAKKADRIAWTVYEAGRRNVYSAVAPAFRPVRLTSFLEDNGQEISDVNLSDDGTIAVFVRGTAPNRDGWVANPTHDPGGSERAIWAVRTNGGPAWRLAEGASPVLSPDGSIVLYVKEGQIYRVRTSRTITRDEMDRGEKPFIRQWGTQSNPQWSPDGSKISFVSSRGDHSFIGLYDVKTARVKYVAPSVDFDSSPTWSPDGKRIAFLRRPGTPFALQTPPATGRGAAPPPNTNPQRRIPGLHSATFANGSTLSVMIADVAAVGDIETNAARELWHNQPGERVFTNLAGMTWAHDNLVFSLNPPGDEWERYWSISTTNPQPAPVLLTTTDGLIEDATSISYSPDGRTFYYTTNAQDIERRDIWAVPTAGGTPVQLTKGDGIETYPQPLASGKHVAVLYFGAQIPASVGIVPATGGEAKLIYPDLKSFPVAAHVVPEIVVVKAPDGLNIHNQLFLPKDMKPGERRPAIVFVHGGPRRQMLPGYHYMQFYHWSYAANQWLANQGYVVLSVNFRRGVGYGASFRNAPGAQASGNSEYQDVLAAGRYLQTRADVDPARIGIWGLSYGGLLTAQALARNSDLFIAGVDMAGVHLYGTSVDSAALSYQSSAVSQMATWKSPVLLVHGDDDRNVNFSQTVGLVQLLRANRIYHELIVIPDDTHESLLHSRWVYTWDRMSDFLKRFVWQKQTATVPN